MREKYELKNSDHYETKKHVQVIYSWEFCEKHFILHCLLLEKLKLKGSVTTMN
jgi:hypothetical protein